jgi:arylsulfatase A-like enzyme
MKFALLAFLLLISQTAHAKPNIIFILADDLGYGDLGSYGQTKISTPNLDEMAKKGLRFTHHYSGSTVCAPSRNSLMTGQHTGHTTIRGNPRGGGVPLRPEDLTIGEILQGAGYITGFIGKWGMGRAGTTGTPNKQGFDHFFGFLNQGNAHFYYPDFLWRNSEKIPNNRYSHDLFTEEALSFIQGNRSRPFFLLVAYTIPHAELLVPEESMSPYEFPETPWEGEHYGHQKRPRAAYAGMISRMDRDVGRILGLIKEIGIEEDTLVLFSSDNGPATAGGADPEFFDSNGPLKGLKGSLREGGIRVPLISYWPGTILPGVTNYPSAFWDWLPTFAELAEAGAPAGDGLSLVPTLLGDAQPEHDYLYWEIHYQTSEQAIRMGKWKGYRESPDSKLEMYDVTDEENDLSSEHPEIVRQIEKYMDEARTPSENYPLENMTLWIKLRRTVKRWLQ